ncbi:MAG: ABC transporter permease, partial [Pseudomonadota bacterium]
DAVVYLSLALVVGVWLWLGRTRPGMVLRAVGENHDAAHALGYRVVAIRLGAIAFGGALAGLGGAYLSLVRVPQWNEGMTAGAGWIALAIVVFGGWNPWRVLLGALLFGGVTILQLNLQAANLTPLWLLAFGLLLFAIWRTLRGSAHPLSILALWLGTLGVGTWAVVAPITVQAQYLSMTPYLVTIVVLTVLSADRLRTSAAPADLGKPFHSAG